MKIYATTPAGLSRLSARTKSYTRAHILECFNNRKRNGEQGALLVEVLVSLLILVIVFTATTMALANMANQRVRVEQRDRALALITRYEEESRVFRCGFAVDRTDAALLGTQQFIDQVGSCDFKADANSVGGTNAGDQHFVRTELIDGTASGPKQQFTVDIRYWWEIPDTDIAGVPVQKNKCGLIEGYLNTTSANGDMPIILVRAFQVSWYEGGVSRKEQLIKRDPAPADNVVFASGTRESILVDPGGSLQTYLAPIAGDNTHYIAKSLMEFGLINLRCAHGILTLRRMMQIVTQHPTEAP